MAVNSAEESRPSAFVLACPRTIGRIAAPAEGT
jgi:hypothetical protein